MEPPVSFFRMYFNPRSPWGERQKFYVCQCTICTFQSTLPVGGATEPCLAGGLGVGISIHAPRGGSDVNPSVIYGSHNTFQSTLPVGGATWLLLAPSLVPLLFQSTLPVGGATILNPLIRSDFFISIHAPRGGSDCSWLQRCCCRFISIHAPRGGSDLPVGVEWSASAISIHAPRGGSDSCHRRYPGADGNFNPRSPWGERPWSLRPTSGRWRFQSTLPVGGATP